MTDTYNTVHIVNITTNIIEVNITDNRFSIIFKFHLTVQLFSMFHLVYKEMSFLATLASMSVFTKDLALTIYTVLGGLGIQTICNW